MRTIRVFISSPSDLTAERKAISARLTASGSFLKKLLGIEIELIDWQHSIIPDMGVPQHVVNVAAKYDKIDVFIGMFWSHFGSATGHINPLSGQPFVSGTEEEFFEAYQTWKTTSRPKIHFYRCSRPLPSSVDPLQLQALNNFFKDFAPTGKNPGMYKAFSDVEELCDSVEAAVYAYVTENSSLSSEENPTRLSNDARREGALDLFLPSHNELRNRAKKKSLDNAKWARLVAYGGHAYIAMHNHFFRDEVERLLDRGGEFQLVILNPWTEWTFLKALSYVAKKPKLSDIKSFSRIDIENIIQTSTPYSVTLQNSLRGYSYLRKKYGRKIGMKMTNWNIEYTALITSNDCYIEPYIMSSVNQRAQKNFNTFELKVGSESGMYENVLAEHKYRYNSGVDIEILINSEASLKDELFSRYGIS